MKINPQQWYHEHLAVNQQEQSQIARKIRFVALGRLLVFMAVLYGAYQTLVSPGMVNGCLLGGCILVFLSLIVWHTRLFERQRYLTAERDAFHAELKGLMLNWEDFDGGERYKDVGHPFSNDLDVFGNTSLYRMVGRCVTVVGSDRLAERMLHPSIVKEEIAATQMGVRELADNPDFLFHFRSEGLLIEEDADNFRRLMKWAVNPSARLHLLWRIGRFAVPACNLILLGGALAGFWGYSFLLTSIVCFFMLSLLLVRKSVAVQQEFGTQLRLLRKYARLIAIWKSHPHQAPHLMKLTARFRAGDVDAIDALLSLSKRLERLDLIHNQLLFFLLEGCCFFQAHILTSLFRWKQTYGQMIPDWMDALADADVLVSYAIYAMNHPDDVYPELDDTGFILEAEEMGHPLMAREACVTNPVHIQGRPYFLIITGANMAGKSTYLRTVGVNYLLGLMGLPVWATKMKMTPVALFTSLRTTDSLEKSESYFFAELKRLQAIIRELQSGRQLFIILDEILKGTNSFDKQQGSLQLMKRLVALHSNGIIATHDLLLGNLKEDFPDHISNYRFEARIKDDELIFDYRIQDGVAQNMNASFLMKKMGIIGDKE